MLSSAASTVPHKIEDTREVFRTEASVRKISYSPNLTGSTGDALVDTGDQEISKAQVQGGEFKPRQVVKV